MVKAFGLFFEDKRIWLILGGSVLFSFILAIGVILLDTRMINVVDYFPTVFLTSVNLAKSILSLLAGSLFSVATFTFGTMLSVISFYSSNFSPRTVENFLLQKTSMQTLGIFLGVLFIVFPLCFLCAIQKMNIWLFRPPLPYCTPLPAFFILRSSFIMWQYPYN